MSDAATYYQAPGAVAASVSGDQRRAGKGLSNQISSVPL